MYLYTSHVCRLIVLKDRLTNNNNHDNNHHSSSSSSSSSFLLGTYRKTKVTKITIILKVSIQPRPQAHFPGFGKAREKRPGDEVGYNSKEE